MAADVVEGKAALIGRELIQLLIIKRHAQSVAARLSISWPPLLSSREMVITVGLFVAHGSGCGVKLGLSCGSRSKIAWDRGMTLLKKTDKIAHQKGRDHSTFADALNRTHKHQGADDFVGNQ